MNISRVSSIVLLIGLSAVSGHAQGTLQIPEVPSADKMFTQLDLPADTVVEDRFFSVLALKGWSVGTVGPSERYLDDITITASKDIVHERTVLSLNTFRVLAGTTGEEKFAMEKAKLKPGDKLTYEMWQDRKWIVKEYACESGTPESAAICWVAWTYDQGGRLGILLASTPETLASRYTSPLRTMMQSVKFHPPKK